MLNSYAIYVTQFIDFVELYRPYFHIRFLFRELHMQKCRITNRGTKIDIEIGDYAMFHLQILLFEESDSFFDLVLMLIKIPSKLIEKFLCTIL